MSIARIAKAESPMAKLLIRDAQFGWLMSRHSAFFGAMINWTFIAK
jgi:hypothetical protein